jgi:hypothetical protein
MLFIERTKIIATRVYEFFEGGNVDTIANSPHKFVWRTNRSAFSELRKSSIHQASGEFVVHTPTVAPQTLAAVRASELLSQTLASRPNHKIIKSSERRYLKQVIVALWHGLMAC